jgi:hypothetical protein
MLTDTISRLGITLTLPDLLLTLLLGVVGSLIAVNIVDQYRRTRRYLADWWARRSAETAAERATLLEEELRSYKTTQANADMFVAKATAMLGRMIANLSVLILVTLSLNIGLVVRELSVISGQIGLDHEQEQPLRLEYYILTSITLIFVIAMGFIVFELLVSRSRLERYVSPKDEEKRLQQSIRRLRARAGPSSEAAPPEA